MIKVGNKANVSKLYIKGLKFRDAFKVLEKYWEVILSLIYMTYSGIEHD